MALRKTTENRVAFDGDELKAALIIYARKCGFEVPDSARIMGAPVSLILTWPATEG